MCKSLKYIWKDSKSLRFGHNYSVQKNSDASFLYDFLYVLPQMWVSGVCFNLFYNIICLVSDNREVTYGGEIYCYNDNLENVKLLFNYYNHEIISLTANIQLLVKLMVVSIMRSHTKFKRTGFIIILVMIHSSSYSKVIFHRLNFAPLSMYYFEH